MNNWADELIKEYTDGCKELKRMKDSLENSNINDAKQINSMIESMSFSVEWLKTGIQPRTYRSINKKSIYHRQFFESLDVIPDIIDQLECINEKRFYLTSEEKKVLADIFVSLSIRERQCFVMYVAEGKSMGNIAEEMQLSKRTVQQYIERARKKVLEKVS
ncbi:RNA polymerase subunit sigma-70 [Solibacillus sp. R5-41]|nr:RNA polymerase subunit sigma-70 [Solibacillus sp. R5-41]